LCGGRLRHIPSTKLGVSSPKKVRFGAAGIVPVDNTPTTLDAR
jgi:hypothetical protein